MYQTNRKQMINRFSGLSIQVAVPKTKLIDTFNSGIKENKDSRKCNTINK